MSDSENNISITDSSENENQLESSKSNELSLIFEKIYAFEQTSICKHCIFVYTSKKKFAYIPFVSSSFFENCKKEFENFFTSHDFKKGDIPKSLTRVTASRRHEKIKKNKAIMDFLVTTIQQSKKLKSYYWFVIQFNFTSPNDCFYTENLPVSDEEKGKFCEFILKEYINSIITVPLEGVPRRKMICKKAAQTIASSLHPVMASETVSNTNIIDSRVVDDE